MNIRKLMLIIVPVLVLAVIVCTPVMLAGCQDDSKQQDDSSLAPDDPNQPGDGQPDTDGPLQDSIFDDDTPGATQGNAGSEDQTQTQRPSDSETAPGENGNSSDTPSPDPKPDDNSTPPAPPSVDTVEPEKLSYTQYYAMTPTDQRLYMESFESVEAFFEWYNAAREKYEQENPSIDVGDGTIDLGGLAGGSN